MLFEFIYLIFEVVTSPHFCYPYKFFFYKNDAANETTQFKENPTNVYCLRLEAEKTA